MTRHLMSRAAASSLLAALAMTLIAAVPQSAAATMHRVQRATIASTGDGTVGTAAARAVRRGYLVRDQRAYEHDKEIAARQVSANAGATAAKPAGRLGAPLALRSWLGANDPYSAPPDPTGSVGPTRYIELVNSRFAIYDKQSNTPLGTGTLNQLAGQASSASLFDPQIIWDAGTGRFYYAMDDVLGDTDNRVAFGFSKTASPNGAADWCRYTLGFGSEFPDYPKLGDTSDFLLIGVNIFTETDDPSADLAWISKPPAGSSCPSAGSLASGVKSTLMEPDGSTRAFTPVPANQIDPAGTGWVVAATEWPGSALGLYRVTRNADGSAQVQSVATSVSVPRYDIPPNARQLGSANVLDTSDTRLTQAISAIDPSRGANGQVAIWTQHTVAGGGGSQVRWYEIDPAAHALFASGKATNSANYDFNGAISPDRAVNGTSKSGGSNMVLTFNASSSATYPAIKMLSKIGGQSQSSQVLVKRSPGPLRGFDCDASQAYCRWGDYAAATPDPTPGSGARIWMVNEFASGTGGYATSRTWNFAASP